MGLSTFTLIAEKLIANGRPAETPAAAVRWATRPDQEVVVGTLASLPGLIRSADCVRRQPLLWARWCGYGTG